MDVYTETYMETYGQVLSIAVTSRSPANSFTSRAPASSFTSRSPVSAFTTSIPGTV